MDRHLVMDSLVVISTSPTILTLVPSLTPTLATFTSLQRGMPTKKIKRMLFSQGTTTFDQLKWKCFSSWSAGVVQVLSKPLYM